MLLSSRLVMALMLSATLAFLTGCPSKPIEPDYARPLPEGYPALRKITNPADIPSFNDAFASRDALLVQAIDRSAAWYGKHSTQAFFPLQDITHDQARASAVAFRSILTASKTPGEFRQNILAEFDVYTSVGWDGSGVVFYTGYYSPILSASPVKTPEYPYPLYKKPLDLIRDPLTGQTQGRNVSGQIKPYPDRAQIDYYPKLLGLEGNELCWLKDKLDRYIVQVQGSAKLRMTDGSTLFIGYAADNGKDYRSIGKMLMNDGKIDKNRAGLPAIREYFRQHPEDIDYYANQNPRYIFFQPYNDSAWPSGALGFPVTDWRSIATDKKIYPRGCVTLVTTQVPAGGGSRRDFQQFMCDQDAGGAIRAPGRADIYMGVGPTAEAVAGQQAAEGRLYYFILKPQRVGNWLTQPLGVN